MGGPGSTRWRDHQKRPLVEESLHLDIVTFRKSGALGPSGGWGDMDWPAHRGRPAGEGRFELHPAQPDGTRVLIVTIARNEQESFTRSVQLMPYTIHHGGLRWFLVCPTCESRRMQLYISQGVTSIACRTCLGLVHRSAQGHDSRLDHCLRDPKGFQEERSRLQSERSKLVTARLILDALDRYLEPRRGRGWGVASYTSRERVLDELGAEFCPPKTDAGLADILREVADELAREEGQ